jgi:hypothetical protein
MKTRTILILLAGAFSLLFTMSCKPKFKPVDNAVRFDSLRIAETAHLFNDTAKPGCNIQIDFIYPDSANAHTLNKLQSLFVEKMFGESFKNINPKQAAADYTQQYIADFKQFENPVIDTTYQDEENQYVDETGYAYYTRLKNTILYNQNGFLSFTVESCVYEGGAHSSKSISGYVYNLATGELLQEDQFSGKNYPRNLAGILAHKLAEANGLKGPEELENLGYVSPDDIAPNGNFTIDNKGITYYFNEGEIAGISDGVIKVFIPYDQLDVCVVKDSPLAPFVNK